MYTSRQSYWTALNNNKNVAFNSLQNKYEIKEFVIDYFVAIGSTGEGLTDLILRNLVKLGFMLKWFSEQGYDNGAIVEGVG